MSKQESNRARWLARTSAYLIVLFTLAGCGVTLEGPNLGPTADAGPDQTARVGQRVLLDGRASVDSDDDPLTYSWQQRSGPSADLETTGNGEASFLVRESGNYEFALTVTDGNGGSDSATTMVFATDAPGLGCPRADAGANQETNEGNTVTLRGSFSSDPEGDHLVYDWYQLSGPHVSLQNPFSVEARFRAPHVEGDETLTFGLIVEDESGCQDDSEVSILVRDRDSGDLCNGIECEDDGVYCNGEEYCLDGECVSSGNPCEGQLTCQEESRSCEEIDTCNPEDCDDGFFCNGAEYCSDANNCEPGSPPCLETQYCDEDADQCHDCIDDADCDDDIFCNGQESCVTGRCASGEAPCDENSQCDESNELCPPICTEELCDDGIFCNGIELCVDGGCSDGVDPCAPGLVCHEDTRQCPEPCIEEECNDGLYCNGEESCLDGVCAAGIPPCQSNEVCDETAQTCIRRGAQIEVVSVQPADDLVGGVGPRRHTCTLRNFGSEDAALTVTLTLGSKRVTIPVTVPALETRTISVDLDTPPSYGGCGQVNDFTLRACANITDNDASDNCKSANARIAVPYWDLRLRIRNADTSVLRCRQARWTVEITNAGNIPYAGGSSYRTGICVNNHPFDFRSCAGPPGFRFLEFCIPRIERGGAFKPWILFDLDCFAFTGTQYIKASIAGKPGCSRPDLCEVGNGAMPVPITIR